MDFNDAMRLGLDFFCSSSFPFSTLLYSLFLSPLLAYYIIFVRISVTVGVFGIVCFLGEWILLSIDTRGGGGGGSASECYGRAC